MKSHEEIESILGSRRYQTNDETENTPLHIATIYGDTDVARYLITNGADINKLCNGMTAMELAVEYKRIHVAIALFEAGADVSFVNKKLHLIHIAAHMGRLPVIKKLIELEPRLINVNDPFHKTPLLWAAAAGHLEVVDFLISHGASIQLSTCLPAAHPGSDENNFSPLDWVMMNGHEDVFSVLIKANAKANQITACSILMLPTFSDILVSNASDIRAVQTNIMSIKDSFIHDITANTTVRLLKLTSPVNYISDAHFKIMATALAYNYSLWEIQFESGNNTINFSAEACEYINLRAMNNVRHDELMTACKNIENYLARNKKMSKAIDILTSVLDTGKWNNTLLNKAIFSLTELVNDPQMPDATQYISEHLRLLKAMQYLNCGDSQMAAVNELLPAFNNIKLQDVADILMSHALIVTKTFNSAEVDPDCKILRFQLIVYGARSNYSLHVRRKLTIGITGLRNEIENRCPGCTSYNETLLSYETALYLAEVARNHGDKILTPHAEKQLLEQCLHQKTFHPVAVNYLLKSPLFLLELQERYPDRTRFRFIESYLLNPFSNESFDLRTLKLNAKPITSTHVNELMLIMHQPENRDFSFITELDKLKQRVTSTPTCSKKRRMDDDTVTFKRLRFFIEERADSSFNIDIATNEPENHISSLPDFNKLN